MGSAGGVKPHIEKYSPPLEKCVGHILKLLYIVQKYLPPWCPKLVTSLVEAGRCFSVCHLSVLTVFINYCNNYFAIIIALDTWMVNTLELENGT